MRLVKNDSQSTSLHLSVQTTYKQLQIEKHEQNGHKYTY